MTFRLVGGIIDEYDECLDGRRVFDECVVDPAKKTFYLYSNEGDTKEVNCDNTEQFMNVLKLVRAACPEDRLLYAEPLSGKNEV